MSNAKPVDELTARDFEDHPIWEYAMDDEDTLDETYVRPVHSSVVPDETWVVYQVACTVTVASGKSYPGFLEICNSAPHFDAPSVVGASSDENAQLLPVRWRLHVPVAGNPQLQSGVFEG